MTGYQGGREVAGHPAPGYAHERSYNLNKILQTTLFRENTLIRLTLFKNVVKMAASLERLNNTLGNNTIECKKLSEFLAFYGVIIQSVIQSFLKTPVCGASLSYS